MNTRFDACTPRPKKDGGTLWVRIGTGWQSDKGMQVVLDALPMPDAEGRCVINLFEPKPRENASGGQQRSQRGGNNSFATDADDMPGWD